MTAFSFVLIEIGDFRERIKQETLLFSKNVWIAPRAQNLILIPILPNYINYFCHYCLLLLIGRGLNIVAFDWFDSGGDSGRNRDVGEFFGWGGVMFGC